MRKYDSLKKSLGIQGSEQKVSISMPAQSREKLKEVMLRLYKETGVTFTYSSALSLLIEREYRRIKDMEPTSSPGTPRSQLTQGFFV